MSQRYRQTAVGPAPSPGLSALCCAPSLSWQEEAFLTKATRLPLSQGEGTSDDEGPRWSAGPHLRALRREEIPVCGGFLWRRRTPGPLPQDTLVFFVTCFSFCFSSLVPFFQGHFHFRLSVSPPPHPHPSFLCRPPFPSHNLGIPSGLACLGLSSLLGGWGRIRGGERTAPCPFPHGGEKERRWLSDCQERLGSAYGSPGSWLKLSRPQAPHL